MIIVEVPQFLPKIFANQALFPLDIKMMVLKSITDSMKNIEVKIEGLYSSGQ